MQKVCCFEFRDFTSYSERPVISFAIAFSEVFRFGQEYFLFFIECHAIQSTYFSNHSTIEIITGW